MRRSILCREKAALDYTEVVMKNSREVPDLVFEELKKHFDEDGIVELTALIGLQNLSSQFNSVLDAASAGFCQLNSSE